jgi:repressor LexA
MQIVDEIIEGVPIMGSVAAGGLIETYSDVQENLDISDVLKKKNVFALTVNGDSMIDACIADGDMVLMEPIENSYSLKNGTIVSAMVPGLGTTLKYFIKKGGKIFLEAANAAYEPIELNLDQVVFQGKLLAVWRKV